METLSNFSSIYCFTAFIIGAMFMLMAICIAAMGKVKEPKNKVRFFVKARLDGWPFLYIQLKTGSLELIAFANNFAAYGLNPEDFTDMKKGEVREVFLNLVD